VHLLTCNLDQHPFPSPAVKTPGPAVPPGLERSAPRYQRLQRGPRLSSVEALSRAIQPAVGHRHHHLAPHHAQHRELRSASGGRRPSLPTASPCPSFRTGVLSRAVVQPASGPASSLMPVLNEVTGKHSQQCALLIQGSIPSSWYTALVPLTAEAIGAIGRARDSLTACADCLVAKL
jgi:hypothetical protein